MNTKFAKSFEAMASFKQIETILNYLKELEQKLDYEINAYTSDNLEALDAAKERLEAIRKEIAEGEVVFAETKGIVDAFIKVE